MEKKIFRQPFEDPRSPLLEPEPRSRRQVLKEGRISLWLIITLIVLGIILLGGGGLFVYKNYFSKRSNESEFPQNQSTNTTEKIEKWGEEKTVIPGKYADADVVDIGEGKLRIYYSLEPEVQGFEGQVYSAVSSDGINWSEEEGIRMKWATFPSVIKLLDGRWRMYYQGSISGSPSQKGILSAISTDGLTWLQEEGIRIILGQQGTYDTENVASPTVINLNDDLYLMVYRGSAGENRFGKMDEFRGKPAPIDYLISAVSKDGLNWIPRSVVVDSRNDKMRDQIDGPELVIDGENIKLYCNSYEGVYVLSLDKEGKALTSPIVVIESTGPEYAPSDVTLMKIDDIWRMYFGLHTKGIFTTKRLD